MPTHVVGTCIYSRSFPLPEDFCVASQCPHFPCTSNAKQTPDSDSVTAPVAPLTASMCIEQAKACQ